MELQDQQELMELQEQQELTDLQDQQELMGLMGLMGLLDQLAVILQTLLLSLMEQQLFVARFLTMGPILELEQLALPTFFI
jgi:hypothetical protein